MQISYCDVSVNYFPLELTKPIYNRTWLSKRYDNIKRCVKEEKLSTRCKEARHTFIGFRRINTCTNYQCTRDSLVKIFTI